MNQINVSLFTKTEFGIIALQMQWNYKNISETHDVWECSFVIIQYFPMLKHKNCHAGQVRKIKNHHEIVVLYVKQFLMVHLHQWERNLKVFRLNCQKGQHLNVKKRKKKWNNSNDIFTCVRFHWNSLVSSSHTIVICSIRIRR